MRKTDPSPVFKFDPGNSDKGGRLWQNAEIVLRGGSGGSLFPYVCDWSGQWYCIK